MNSGRRAGPAGGRRGIVRLTGVSAASAVAMVAAACGGSGAAAGGGTTTTGPEQAKAAITTAWTSFFAAGAPLDQEVAVLQNGSAHRSQIEALHKQMPAHLAVRVVSVALSGPQATVTYDLLDNGQPLLNQHSTGRAVLVGGRWLVSESTFCSLVSLAGSSC